MHSLEPDLDREFHEHVRAAGDVRNTKDRDAQDLEVRAGSLGVERTTQGASGLSSTNRMRDKVARTSVENGP